MFAYIPIESQIEKFQDQYYDAIASCHVAGSSTIFIQFMLEQIDQILDELTANLSDLNQTLTDQIRRLLDAMDYDVPYTAAALMEKLQMKSRESFRSNYLQPAIHMGFIQMTIPEKPNSRNQRYVKV